MGKAENKIERYLHNEIIKLEGTTKKWKSPQNAGVPDRIVFLPEGKIYFVEVKADDGDESTVQKRVREELTLLGCKCFVVYGRYGVNQFITAMKTKLV